MNLVRLFSISKTSFPYLLKAYNNLVTTMQYKYMAISTMERTNDDGRSHALGTARVEAHGEKVLPGRSPW